MKNYRIDLIYLIRRIRKQRNRLLAFLSKKKLNRKQFRRVFKIVKTLNKYCRRLVMSTYGFGMIMQANINQLYGQPLGSEFLVNTQTIGDQHLSSIAMRPNGDFAVVWAEFNIVDNIRNADIVLRLFNAGGLPQSEEIIIYIEGSNTVGNPDIAMDSQGNFIVVWECDDPSNPGDFSNICGQRYNANGVELGQIFTINTFRPDFQRKPEVAMNAEGDFVVVWESRYQLSTTEKDEVYGQQFWADGTPRGSEFRINQTTAEDQKNVAVAMDDQGNFIAVWNSENADVNTKFDIFARRYSADGTPVSSEFMVNTFDADNQILPDIAMDKNGDFVVGWQSKGQAVPNQYSVYAQLYKSNGTTVGNEFRVDDPDPNNILSGGVATSMDERGNFAITWTDFNDGDLLGISAKCFLANGNSIGNQLRVNTETDNIQIDAEIAMDADGDFVVVWSSFYQEPPSTEGFVNYGVYGQRFQSKFPNNCNADSIVLSGAQRGVSIQQTTAFIESNQNIEINANVVYSAPQYVQLNPGFTVATGADLEVNNDNCNE